MPSDGRTSLTHSRMADGLAIGLQLRIPIISLTRRLTVPILSVAPAWMVVSTVLTTIVGLLERVAIIHMFPSQPYLVLLVRLQHLLTHPLVRCRHLLILLTRAITIPPILR